ncbi:phosphatase PAP2 family protein [Methanoregula sp. UBA64]|uniref:phosphatase PAP2 family protein n=1 Tax=Methanoregula sp. UBA64 TaxID=1915554 RepID=UPI0025F2402C|nr:phosphatase PAP2 family protein [Methanoregula sp. UBA64]
MYLVVVILLYLGFHPKYGVRLAALFGIAGGLNEALKLFFHLPRPYWVSAAVKAYYSVPSFGFPSGGAMCSVVVYGYVAAAVRKYWVVMVCAVLLAWAVLARIFAGVHFLLDVIGGLFFGVLLLLAFHVLAPKAEGFAAGLRKPARVLCIFLVAALPLLFVVPAYLSLAGWLMPPEWAAMAANQTGALIDPVRIRYTWDACSLILGCLLGYEFLTGRGGWTPPKRVLLRGMIALFGAASSLALIVWITEVLSMPGTALPYPVAPFVSIACAGFWFSACVPLAARKLGFGSKDPGSM